jgi:hypothetical protein
VGRADEAWIRFADTGAMQSSKPRSVRYAAAFREGDRPVATGAVVVKDDRLLLQGRQEDARYELSISYAELTRVQIGHRTRDRLNGYPTVVLVRRTGPPVHIAPLGFGLRLELADIVAALLAKQAGTAECVVIVVPLKSGSREGVKALVADGPPFDSADLGLVRHRVFLNQGEAIFVLEGPSARDVLARALEKPDSWRTGLSWRKLTSGPPRIAEAPFDAARAGELVYSWIAEGA